MSRAGLGRQKGRLSADACARACVRAWVGGGIRSRLHPPSTSRSPARPPDMPSACVRACRASSADGLKKNIWGKGLGEEGEDGVATSPASLPELLHMDLSPRAKVGRERHSQFPTKQLPHLTWHSCFAGGCCK